jgi:hypothetical protein
MSAPRPSTSEMICSLVQLSTIRLPLTPAQHDVEVLEPVEEIRAEPARRPYNLERHNPIRENVERHAQLHFGQARSDAHVLARSEAQVRVLRPRDVEPVRRIEHRLVAVARNVPQHNLVALGDLLAAQLCIRHGRPPHVQDGRGMATISGVAVFSRYGRAAAWPTDRGFRRSAARFATANCAWSRWRQRERGIRLPTKSRKAIFSPWISTLASSEAMSCEGASRRASNSSLAKAKKSASVAAMASGLWRKSGSSSPTKALVQS